MRRRHVTHLLVRYAHGQLRPAQRAEVVNHVRTCDACRAALAREERLVKDLRREMPAFGQPSTRQLAQVWAGVWGDLAAPRRGTGGAGTTWLPGLSFAVAVLLAVLVVLPLAASGGIRAEAAPLQPRPADLTGPASPTLVVTGDAPTQDVSFSARGDLPATPAATVALVSRAGASPVPVPGVTTSPEALRVGRFAP